MSDLKLHWEIDRFAEYRCSESESWENLASSTERALFNFRLVLDFLFFLCGDGFWTLGECFMVRDDCTCNSFLGERSSGFKA